MNDMGIIGTDGKVLLYYGDRDYIVVKSCEPHTVLGKTPKEAKANCQGKFNRIPIPYFRMTLRAIVTKIGLNGLKSFTPDEAKGYGNYKLTDAQAEWMKNEFAKLPKELDRINAFIATYGPENNEGVREELLNRQKNYEDYLSVLKKIDAEIEKGINFITDQTTLSLKKSSTDKEQFLYTVLKQFDPETKVPCGLSGSLDERIKDCSYQPDAIKGQFVLVRRAKDFSEVYMNSRNGQLWSDIIPGVYPQNKAGEACGTNPELRKLARNRFLWRAPLIEEYVNAEAYGIKEALHNIHYWQWSTSVTGGLFAKERKGYLYSANDPKPIAWDQDIDNYVRCVSTL